MTDDTPSELRIVSAQGLARLTAYAATHAESMGDTVLPPREGSSESSRAALSAFEELGALLRARGAHGIVPGPVIGEGGMGVVSQATQVALGREIALKTLKHSAQSREQRLDLLREAWITGSLEHPNIVPVHDVTMDATGGPAIVLKRIEGVAWSDVIHDPVAIRDRFGVSDALEWNLRTLMTVTNALAFAHERGIVHRDVKPDNVMLGRFGEVYVVDWGIAVSTRGDDDRLPNAAHATAMAGTPSYMAPEMLGDMGIAVGPRSDVYLLGATLYEILAGRPPHVGTTMMEIVASVIRSEVSFDEEVPEEIASVCRRALARDPNQRFASAETLRGAIGEFLQHRGSYALSASADSHRQRLREARAAGAPVEAVHGLLGECRFGYRAALEAWSGNRSARRGLDEVLAESAEYELEQGRPESAALLIAECAERPVELSSRVDRALADANHAKSRLDQLVIDNDVSVGRNTRLAIMTILGALWTGSPIAFHFLPEIITPLNVFLGLLATLACASSLLFWGWASLTTTRVNKRMTATIFSVLVFQVVLSGTALAAGVPLAVLMPILPVLYTTGSIGLCVWVEVKTWPGIAVGVLASAIALAKPAWYFPGIFVWSLTQTLAVISVWGRNADFGGDRARGV